MHTTHTVLYMNHPAQWITDIHRTYSSLCSNQFFKLQQWKLNQFMWRHIRNGTYGVVGAAWHLWLTKLLFPSPTLEGQLAGGLLAWYRASSTNRQNKDEVQPFQRNHNINIFLPPIFTAVITGRNINSIKQSCNHLVQERDHAPDVGQTARTESML